MSKRWQAGDVCLIDGDLHVVHEVEPTAKVPRLRCERADKGAPQFEVHSSEVHRIDTRELKKRYTRLQAESAIVEQVLLNREKQT